MGTLLGYPTIALPQWKDGELVKNVNKTHEQSHYIYRSRAGSHFYGTEYEIWADFGPVGNIKKKNWAVKYATFEGVSLCFHGHLKKIF